MTLENVIKEWGKSIVVDEGLIDDLKQSILSWFKEQLPKKREIVHSERHPYTLHDRGYNQAIADILTKLT